MYDIFYIWNLKNDNKVVNITTTNKKPDSENRLVFTSGERKRGRGNINVGDEEVQTII